VGCMCVARDCAATRAHRFVAAAIHRIWESENLCNEHKGRHEYVCVITARKKKDQI
jgi:hypothetical protein